MKMRKQGGKWIVEDNERTITFEKSYDAWLYVFMMKGVRPNAPTPPKTLHPVRSLNPVPMMRKKVICAAGGSERV